MPFELGRPLGAPHHAAFQTKVLRAALALLEAPSGPLLVDFPEDAPDTLEEATPLVCPVSFAAIPEATDGPAALAAAMQQEIQQLRSWYDLSLRQRGRTTVGISRLTPEAVGALLGEVLEGRVPESPRDDVPLADVIKLALEDLKAYYAEAIAAQPGQANLRSEAFGDWFWGETAAGAAMYAMYQVCKDSTIPGLQVIGAGMLIPRARSQAVR